MSAEYGIPIAVGFVSALMLGVAQLRQHLAIDAESSRKIVHIGSGVLAMSFPWLFTSAAPVVAACVVSAALLALCRHTDLVPARLKNVLGGVRRRSVGEYCFPLAVAILFPLSRGDWTLYLVPVAILAFSDTAAGLVGSRWGKTRYFALAGRKSVEGSLAFFVATFAITTAMLTVLTDLELGTVIFVTAWLALATTLTEAVSTGGADNLSVPLVAYLFLQLSLGKQSYGPWIEAVVLLTLVLTLAVLRYRHADPAHPDYLARMTAYLGEMFPIPLRVVTAGAFFAGISSMVRLILGSETGLWNTWTVVGIWTLFAHLLLLRLMDELKDVEIDRELFPERPLPSGRISEHDVRLGMALITVAFLVFNLAIRPALGSALLLLAYSFLMFRYFFVPGLLRHNLLPNLATHNPVVALVVLYVVTLAAAEHGLAPEEFGAGNILLLVGFFWPATFAWEIARKIRSAEEENAYVTYSQVFGRKRAVLVVASAQLMTVAIGLYFHFRLGLSILFPALLLVALTVALFGHLRFVLWPGPGTSQLRPWSEAFLFGVLSAAILELQLGHFLIGV